MPHVPGHTFAQEFTPELDENLLQRLSQRVERRGRRAVGRARGAALRRGLQGDPFEASAVSGAEGRTGEALADLEADFAFRRAGLQREERLLGEGRTFATGEREARQEFTAGQRALDRASAFDLFQRRAGLAQEQEEGAFFQSLIGAGGRIGGAFAGRRF